MAKLSTSSLRRRLHVCCLNRLELFRRSAVWYFKDLSQYTSSGSKTVPFRVRRFRDPAPISERWSAPKPFPWRGSTRNPRDSALRSSVGKMNWAGAVTALPERKLPDRALDLTSTRQLRIQYGHRPLNPYLGLAYPVVVPIRCPKRFRDKHSDLDAARRSWKPSPKYAATSLGTSARLRVSLPPEASSMRRHHFGRSIRERAGAGDRVLSSPWIRRKTSCKQPTRTIIVPNISNDSSNIFSVREDPKK